MTPTLRLGTIAGVRVGMHWSVLGILIVLVVGLGYASWPRVLPGYPAYAYAVAALVAAVLFLASLLAHELAHAVVARRNGIGVEGITLWLLGGVARLRGETRSPGADLRIAGVGPLMSVLVGAGFGLVAWLCATVDAPSLVSIVPAYLAVINGVLAAFNLIPAAPLDGGRILRAALWAWRGDRTRAAVWSARAGRGLGLALVFLGAWRLLFDGAGNGLWWILIGLFIASMAGAEERQAELGSALAGVRVRDVMTPGPDTADGDATVSAFLHDVALVRRHSAFPLLDEHGRLQGLITLNRLKSVPAERRDTTRLADVACPPVDVPLAEPDEPLSDLLQRLGGCTDGRALVFSDGELAGIVSPSDISRMVTLRGIGAGRQGTGADLTGEPYVPPGRRM